MASIEDALVIGELHMLISVPLWYSQRALIGGAGDRRELHGFPTVTDS